MDRALGFSFSPPMRGVDEKERERLNRIGFKKGQSGNKKGRPVTNTYIQMLARANSCEAVEELVAIMRKHTNSAYMRVQAARAILTLGFGKTKSMRELGRLNVWKEMQYYQLTGRGIPDWRARVMIDKEIENDPELKALVDLDTKKN